MARQNPGKSVSSDNNFSLPPVPTNPSRVDRLVIDSIREHAKVSLTQTLSDVVCYSEFGLQRFDTVGWVAGRASGL